MKVLALSLFAVVAMATVMVAADPKLEGVKCIVAPRPIAADKSTEYKDGKVFFCCGNCLAKFKSGPEAFAPKANHQLVVTEQYEQKGCPISGQPFDESIVVDVQGVKVGLCCNNCEAKLAGASGDDQVKMAFGGQPFKKAFAKSKPASE